MSDRTVREIGEFGLIEALRGALPPAVTAGDALKLGIGDDAAVWTPEPGESLVVTTDSLVEGVHFRHDWTDWRSLGHKLLAVNLSDLAAMGARPRLAVLTLALRGTERVIDLQAMYEGIGALALRTGTMIAGGDIVGSPDCLQIHVTAIGETRGGRWLSRSTAQPGDLVCVSGTLGASAAGYRLLRDDGSARRTATADLLIEAHLRPEPRIVLGQMLVESGVTCAMDLSDGLFGDLPKILKASGVSATVDADRVPVAAAVRALFPREWLELATRGGEDYELLFVLSPERFSSVKGRAETLGATITVIGEIDQHTSQPSLFMRDSTGERTYVRAGAFDHFA